MPTYSSVKRRLVNDLPNLFRHLTILTYHRLGAGPFGRGRVCPGDFFGP